MQTNSECPKDLFIFFFMSKDKRKSHNLNLYHDISDNGYIISILKYSKI